jgi:hypothetical protein
MFVACHDEAVGVMIGMYSSGATDDDGHAHCLSSVTRTSNSASLNNVPSVCIIVTNYDTPPPPPMWRRRMAESNKSLRSERHYFALVCPNPLQRGVLTAIMWITGWRKNHHYAAFATFGDAVSWVQRLTDQSYPMMNQLYEVVYGQLQDAIGGAARDAAPRF